MMSELGPGWRGLKFQGQELSHDPAGNGESQEVLEQRSERLRAELQEFKLSA